VTTCFRIHAWFRPHPLGESTLIAIEVHNPTLALAAARALREDRVHFTSVHLLTVHPDGDREVSF
jgi:hypothetical protein